MVVQCFCALSVCVFSPGIHVPYLQISVLNHPLSTFECCWMLELWKAAGFCSTDAEQLGRVQHQARLFSVFVRVMHSTLSLLFFSGTYFCHLYGLLCYLCLYGMKCVSGHYIYIYIFPLSTPTPSLHVSYSFTLPVVELLKYYYTERIA